MTQPTGTSPSLLCASEKFHRSEMHPELQAGMPALPGAFSEQNEILCHLHQNVAIYDAVQARAALHLYQRRASSCEQVYPSEAP